MKILFSIILLTTLLFSSEYAKLVRIVDGDTFVLQSHSRGKFKCRVYGIDTPEKFGGKKLSKDAKRGHVAKGVVKQAGIKATEFAKSVLTIGKRYPVVSYGKGYYGRVLCDVKTPRGLYSVLSVKNGYAVVYKQGKYIKDSTLKHKLLNAERKAKSSRKGLWRDHYFSRVMESME